MYAGVDVGGGGGELMMIADEEVDWNKRGWWRKKIDGEIGGEMWAQR